MDIENEVRSTVSLELAKKVVLNISFTRNILHDGFHDILKPFDISSEQYNVLRILRGQKGAPINMCDIQVRMIAKNSNTTRLIDKLLFKNMVTRNECPENRRKIEILITEKGLSTLATLDPIIVAYENNFAANLSEHDLLVLNNLLEKYRITK